MFVKRWDKLPADMQNDEVMPYYELLRKKIGSLLVKRIFDIAMSIVLLIVLSPIFLIVAILIKADSKGPVFYRQERVTQYGIGVQTPIKSAISRTSWLIKKRVLFMKKASCKLLSKDAFAYISKDTVMWC